MCWDVIVTLPAGGRFTIDVTEEMIRHSRIRDFLYFTWFAYIVAALILILRTGLSARLRDVASSAARKPFLRAVVYVALLTIVLSVIEFPLSYYSGFVVPHQFDLSNQFLIEWFVEWGKEAGVTVLLASIIGALVLVMIAKYRRWWLRVWFLSIPVMVFLIVIAPIFIDPLFNRFEPLRNAVLKEKLLAMASRAGIEGGRVYEVDKSKQTKTMNAYVTGLGPTKRIVMWDTLLAKMTEDEVLGVMGHEMGHYVLHHVWKGLGAAIVVAFAILLAAQSIYDRGIGRWGGSWQVTGPADPAALPWLMILATVTLFILSPVISSFSRDQEHQADVFALELTHLNEAMATAFIKLAEDTKINPYPHPFIEFWRYSHPSLGKRIEFVLARRWRPRRPPATLNPSSRVAQPFDQQLAHRH